ncbi:MAG: hypothetical protein HY043_16845, partial [Verrucomicrobia bacterium]|nr:hypothetical protein [Verrucomicrobiota bacterium]
MFVIDQLKKNDRTMQAVAIGVLAGIGLLLGGLWYVQVIASKRYQDNLKNQSFRTVRIPAIRGQILDRNRIPLAENRAAFDINLYLEELREPFRAAYHNEKAGRKLSRAQIFELGQRTRFLVVSNVVNRLSSVLEQPVAFSETQFRQHYDRRLALPLPVLTNLGPTQIARFQENAGRTPGLDLEIQPVRHYPHHSTAAHLLGYLQRTEGIDGEDENIAFHYRLPDFKGVVGLEAYFDDELRGTAGVKSVLVNSLGYRQSETIITPAEPGQNVVLTIDLPLQKVAEKALRSRNPNERGAVVVLDVRNGDVIALASSPAPDPNQFIPRITQEYWNELNDPKQLPLINRATGSYFAPGSIFKIIVGLAGLEAGFINPSVTLTNPGYIMLGNRRIRDTAPPGDYDFHRAFLKSSNTYFIQTGLATGLDRILEMGRRFHLGEPTELPTRQNERGFFPTREWINAQRACGNLWTEGNTANLCIGQGQIAVTPLQMAVMTAAVANGGKVFTPRLVQRIEPQEGTGDDVAPRDFPTKLRNELNVQPANLALIRDAMRADVEEDGTGWRAAVPGMRV